MTKKTKAKNEPTPVNTEPNEEGTATAGHSGDVQETALTQDRLEELLGGRRKLSPEEKSKLLDRINVLRLGPLNTPEAAEALLAICKSGTFICCGGEWPGFFKRGLGWTAEDGLRILNLYKEGRWAEVAPPAVSNSNLPPNCQKDRDPESTKPKNRPSGSRRAEHIQSKQVGENEQKKGEPEGSALQDEAVETTSTGGAAIEQPLENVAALVAADLVPAAELSKKEEVLFGDCEAIISENTQALFEVGEALRQIRDGKLYRAEFGTFEEYCRKRWNFTRSWAYNQLKSVDVRDNLSTSGGQPEPVNERQLRPLASLQPDEQRAAWKRAAELADGKMITSSHVQKAVKELLGEATPKKIAKPFNAESDWNALEKVMMRSVKLWTGSERELKHRLERFIAENLRLGIADDDAKR